MATRYRCDACGALTRFDITKTTKKKGFYHFTVAGELIEVLEEETLSEEINEVSCRWCGHGRDIRVIEDPNPAETPTQ